MENPNPNLKWMMNRGTPIFSGAFTEAPSKSGQAPEVATDDQHRSFSLLPGVFTIGGLVEG